MHKNRPERSKNQSPEENQKVYTIYATYSVALLKLAENNVRSKVCVVTTCGLGIK